MISKKALLLYEKVVGMALFPPPPPPSPCFADPLYLFTLFLFYLYSCANVIAKLITKAKAMPVIQN